MQHAKLVVVRSYGSRPEADLAKGALEDADIQAMIKADTAGGMREHLAWSGAGVQILGREGDATLARDVLAPSAESDQIPEPGLSNRPRPSCARHKYPPSVDRQL